MKGGSAKLNSTRSKRSVRLGEIGSRYGIYRMFGGGGNAVHAAFSWTSSRRGFAASQKISVLCFEIGRQIEAVR